MNEVVTATVSRAEVEDKIIEVQNTLKRLDRLAEKHASKQDLEAICLGNCKRRQRWVQLATRNA